VYVLHGAKNENVMNLNPRMG